MKFKMVNLRKVVISLLAVVMSIQLLPLQAFAWDPNAGGGGNTGNVGGGTYSMHFAGYRITVLDGAEPLFGADSCRDILFSPPPSNSIRYYTNKLGNCEATVKSRLISEYVGEIEQMPLPILYQGGSFVANGPAVREYLLHSILPGGGTAGGDQGNLDFDKPYVPSAPPSGGTGGGNKPPNQESGDHLISSYKEGLNEVAAPLLNSLTNIITRIENAGSIKGIDTPMPLNVFNSEIDKYINTVKQKLNGLLASGVLNVQEVGLIIGEMNNYANYLKQQYRLEMVLYNRVFTSALLADNLKDQAANNAFKPNSPAAFVSAKPDNNKFELQTLKLKDLDLAIPLADKPTDTKTEAPAEAGSAKVGKLEPLLKVCFSEDIPDAIDKILAAKDAKIMVETVVWYRPVSLSGNIAGTYVYGTADNIAQFNMANADKLGSPNGANMANLTNNGLPKSLMLDTSDPILGLDAPSNRNGFIQSVELDTNQGYGIHIYSRNGAAGTHTWDNITYPTGDPGPAPEYTPNTPNPDDPTAPETPTDPTDPETPDNPNNPYKITIIKYYERNDTPESNFTREKNPSSIQIQDEPLYSLENWFISSTKSIPTSQTTDYDEVKASISNASTGTTPQTVNVVDPNTTLYVKLVAIDPAVIPMGDLVIQQSQISKSISTLHNTAAGWGERTFNFSCASMSGSHIYYDGCGDDDDPCPGHNCSYTFGDSSYDFYFLNSAPIDSKIQAELAEGFGAVYTRVEAESKGNWGLGGGNRRITGYDHESVIWRGANLAGIPDVPTLANYKKNDANNQVDVINKLVTYRANIPAKQRKQNNIDYQIPIMIQLAVDTSLSDLTAYSVHGRCGGGTAVDGGVHQTETIPSHMGNVTVRVYAGKTGQVGNETSPSKLQVTMNFGSAPANAQSGFMVQSQSELKFYPYIRMTYQVPRQYDPSRTNVNVVSEFLRSMKPNDYAEAGWYQTEDEALKLTSNQWSTHARAINNGKDWNGKNQVLPGGAIYNLNTIDDATKVKVATWQTFVEGEQRDIINSMGTGLSASDFTLAGAKKEHTDYANLAEKALDTLRVVQWVNKNTGADKAWDGGLKILGGNQELNSIGLPNKTGPEDKYYMKPDASGNSGIANEGDLDILAKQYQEFYFKLWSDVEGNIFIGESASSSDILNVTSGTKLFDRKVKWEDANKKLTGKYKELDDKTKFITNFMKSLERNTGDDKTAAWSLTDGKWYNEAWDGVYMAYQATTFDVGFKNPGTRSSALDPALCPSNSGQADLFSTAFLSQFRMNDKSDAFPDKESNYIGTFKGKDIVMDELEDVYNSMKFYIPNVVVSDLN